MIFLKFLIFFYMHIYIDYILNISNEQNNNKQNATHYSPVQIRMTAALYKKKKGMQMINDGWQDNKIT